MFQAQDRDEEILHYLPLVEKVVSGLRMKNSQHERGDLINFGVIGLMDALDKYHGDKNVPFESYAYTRIRGAIIDEIRKTSPISRTGMDKLKAYYRVKEELEQALRREPTEHEIAARLNLSNKHLDDIYDIIHQLSAVSLEMLVFQDEGTQSELVNFVEDTHALSVEENILEQEKKTELTEAIRLLPEREQQILQLYYVEKLPLKEIAFIFDISVPRVSQIHGKIIATLRDYMRRKDLD
ncbi:sigma-70 family RNA polymerase sigma factor [Jeotgalibaca caeni]|uniref:sigma-70 family RNA polymerase sigma factor n=1 Tax=Jeotgalibaca caeni TaxID=3028623 RepID=UPI00237DD7AA|nr:FliA/WhiG family RNA polymerase sigma factor [Jeotgalibaca caeni]MDE1548266.1 FliA/WhiG family RNA polymerase sigma factor [Jeotgalibaca caeni]